MTFGGDKTFSYLDIPDAWPKQWNEPWALYNYCLLIPRQHWTTEMTMIYTEMEAKRLADKAVEEALDEGTRKGEHPMTEEEKERIWNLVKQSCNG